MLNAPEPACLVIADISGYTSYLAGVELDHAQDILADLMDTVVGSLPAGVPAGQARGRRGVLYASTETVDGSALQDTIERTYFAFRRRLRDIAPGLDMRLQRVHPHARASTSRSSPTTARSPGSGSPAARSSSGGR